MREYRNTSQNIPRKGEINNGKLHTIPNLAPSMRDLLTRHALGITDNVSYQGNFTGDLPDLRGVEPHDLKDLIYTNRQRLKELEEIKNAQATQLQQLQYEEKKKRDRERHIRIQKELSKEE